ncbi:MAG TPA: nicotinate-nucleotide adenylyltransferase [Terriglobales bacterium]|nr:nicotinate-nucleotide adenylyltransferase [Terriglobales bacterium]
MNVGLFGGTFDPIHRGHLAVARAARERFQLGRILFVPAGSPPHKNNQPITSFAHRYAMAALATAGEKTFVPSDIESPEHLGDRPSYTIDTVRRLKKQLKKSDRLFFLIGMDAFKDIAKWRQPEDVLRETEFIVMARPGFSLGEIGASLPESMRPAPAVTRALKQQPAAGDIVLAGATIHLLPDTHEKISATQIRAAARTGRKLDSLVGPAVADYIRKSGIYKDPARTTGGNKATSHSNVVQFARR